MLLGIFFGYCSCEKVFTLPETNIAPENGSSQKETSLPTIHFQVRTVSFREGINFSLFERKIIFDANWSHPHRRGFKVLGLSHPNLNPGSL